MDTHHLQFILPKFFLVGLVQEWEFPNIMNKYISKDRKFRVNRSDFSVFRLERRSETTKSRRGIEFGDLFLDLAGDEFAL